MPNHPQVQQTDAGYAITQDIHPRATDSFATSFGAFSSPTRRVSFPASFASPTATFPRTTSTSSPKSSINPTIIGVVVGVVALALIAGFIRGLRARRRAGKASVIVVQPQQPEVEFRPEAPPVVQNYPPMGPSFPPPLPTIPSPQAWMNDPMRNGAGWVSGPPGVPGVGPNVPHPPISHPNTIGGGAYGGGNVNNNPYYANPSVDANTYYTNINANLTNTYHAAPNVDTTSAYHATPNVNTTSSPHVNPNVNTTGSSHVNPNVNIPSTSHIIPKVDAASTSHVIMKVNPASTSHVNPNANAFSTPHIKPNTNPSTKASEIILDNFNTSSINATANANAGANAEDLHKRMQRVQQLMVELHQLTLRAQGSADLAEEDRILEIKEELKELTGQSTGDAALGTPGILNETGVKEQAPPSYETVVDAILIESTTDGGARR